MDARQKQYETWTKEKKQQQMLATKAFNNAHWTCYGFENAPCSKFSNSKRSRFFAPSFPHKKKIFYIFVLFSFYSIRFHLVLIEVDHLFMI